MMKKRAILGILLAVFTAALAYRITHPYRQQKVARLMYSGFRKRMVVENDTGGKNRFAKTPEVMLGLFSNPPHHHGEVIHDPFFEPSRNRGAVDRAPVTRARSVEKKVVPPGESPEERVRAALRRFRVFGSCQGDGTNMIFLERGKDILIVRAGDKIDGKYLVKDIKGNSLDVWAEGIQQDLHVDLSDN